MHSRDWHLSCAGGLLALSLAAWAGSPPRVMPAPAASPETANLITSALERMEEDPQLGLRLLLEAQARGPSLEGTSALREWLGRPGRAVLRGHEGPVRAVAFSPDGQQVATASEDGTVRLWDGISGRPMAVLRGHEGPVRAMAFRPDGAWLATGGADGTVRLWEPATGKELEVLRGHSGAVKNLLFRPGPARPQLVSVAEDGTAYLWHGREGGQPMPLGDEGRVHSVAFDAKGSRLLTMGRDDYTREWDPDTGEFLAEWFTHGIKFRSLAFSPDGSRVVGTEGKAQVVLLSASEEEREQEGSLERIQHGLGDEPVLLARFGPDGQRILSVDDEGQGFLWKPRDRYDYGPGRYRWLPMSPAGVRSVHFAPRSPYLLTVDMDGRARLWTSRDTSDKPLLELWGPGDEVQVADFSPDGSRIVTAGGDGTARLWAVPDFNPEALELPMYLGLYRTPKVDEALFSPDGTLLLTREESSQVRLWDATSGRELRKLRTRGRRLLSMAFDAQGERIATLGQFDDHLRQWETASGRPLRREPLPGVLHLFTALRALLWREPPPSVEGSVTFSPDGRRILTHFTQHDALLWTEQRGRSLKLKGTASSLRPAFSPDGQRVATGGGLDEVVLWDAITGRELHRLRHDPASELVSLTFNPDGRLLATAARGPPFVQIWEVASGRLLGGLHDVPMLTPTALAFSPDGTRLVITSEGRLANWIWQPFTGEPLAPMLPPSDSPPHSVAFSPDGTLLLSVGKQGDVRLWSITGRTPLWELREPEATQRFAAFSPDGGRLLTVNTDNAVQVRVCALCAPVEELVAQARPFLARELTCAERREYLHEDITCPPSEERPER